MKKTFFIAISLVAVFFFAGTAETMAQWSFDAGWDHSNCSCANITSKDLEWEIVNLDNSTVFASGSLDITSLTSPQTISGSETPVADAEYEICIKVYYYEAAIDPLCCYGDKCEKTDSAKLLAGTTTVTTTMN